MKLRKIKIIGAGSIGNHLANASRRMGWSVVVCDVSEQALERMRADIYPSRYGSWDPEIQLCLAPAQPKGSFDMILIGTPPDTHVALARAAIEEKPGLVLVEKPFCPPSMQGVTQMVERSRELGVPVFVGFDHAVGQSMSRVREILNSGELGRIITHDVEFREHWQGIFKAHPWLAGPQDSYLGFWERGGGASSEHSHALHLWLTIASWIGAGQVSEVSAMIEYVKTDQVDYDSLFSLNLRTAGGLVGRVLQDVVTLPTRKYARIQGTEGLLEWWNNYTPEADAVIISKGGKSLDFIFKKTRPDDFIAELTHLDATLRDGGSSPLGMESGLDTVSIVAAAHVSARSGRAARPEFLRVGV